METIRSVVSQVRAAYKLTEDSFVTDRTVYKIFKKYADLLMRRRYNEKKLMNNTSIFQWLDKIEMIEVSRIDAECSKVNTNCKFYRSAKKIPKVVSYDDGPIIKLVMTLDVSEKIEKTTLLKYLQMGKSVNFKYNKTNYYWIKNDYIFSTVPYSLTMEALFEEDVKSFCESTCDEKPKCKLKQDSRIPYSSDMVADIIGMMKNELGTLAQIPQDLQDNAQNIMR